MSLLQKRDKINEETIRKASNMEQAHKVAEKVDVKKIMDSNKAADSILKRVWTKDDDADIVSPFGSKEKEETVQPEGKRESFYNRSSASYKDEKKEEEKKSSGYSWGNSSSSSKYSTKKKVIYDPVQRAKINGFKRDMNRVKVILEQKLMEKEEFFNIVGEKEMWIQENKRMKIEDYTQAQIRQSREDSSIVDAILKVNESSSKTIVNSMKGLYSKRRRNIRNDKKTNG